MDKALDKLFELTYGGVARKQRSITKLFPTFPARVRAVAAKGGIRLVDTGYDTWHFKVHSGTKDGVWYDDYVRFLELPDLISGLVRNPRLWTRDKQHVNLTKLAKEVLNRADIQLFCSCPADLYWGGHYIRTQRNAKYTNPENRPPKVRNPREYGAICKHGQALLNVYPWYISTMAKWLNDKFGRQIQKIENRLKGKRGTKESLQEGRKGVVLTPSDIENWWITPSGKLLPLRRNNLGHAEDAAQILMQKGMEIPEDPEWDIDLKIFGKETGYIRAYGWVDKYEVGVDILSDKITPAQINTIRKLAKDYEEFIWSKGEEWGKGLKSWESHLSRIGVQEHRLSDREKDKRRFICPDCKRDVRKLKEYDYMVKDKIWREVITQHEEDYHNPMLCIRCLERRLGRKLTPSDFPKWVRVNQGDAEWSDLLRDRMGIKENTNETSEQEKWFEEEEVKEDLSTVSDPKLKRMFVEDKIEDLERRIKDLEIIAKTLPKGFMQSSVYAKIDKHQKEISDLRRSMGEGVENG